MYSCYAHGWSSLQTMCPSCFTQITTTTSGTGEITNTTDGKEHPDYGLPKIEVKPDLSGSIWPQMDINGHLLLKCPACQKEGKGAIEWKE